MGASTASQMKVMLTKAAYTEKSTWAIIVGILTIVYGATGIFAQLQKVLNVIWEVEAKPTRNGFIEYLKSRIFSFGLVIVVGFLLLISLVISSVLVAISDWLNVSSGFLGTVLVGVNFLVSLGVITFLFALIFKYLPDAKIKWRQVWFGAAVTAILFILGKYLLSIYFATTEPGEDYGAAGSVILILLWVSYSSLIVFYGAEFTRAYSRLYNDKAPPVEFSEKNKGSRKKKSGL
jgi:membrane protein